MGLVANCFRYQWSGMAEGTAHALLPGSWNSSHQWQKQIALDGASAVRQGMANPPGQYLSDVWDAPIVVGEMALRTDSAGDLSGGLIPSYPMSVDMTGAGDLDATGALAVAMALALTGSGTLTATIEGRLNASVDMTGAGDLTATIEGLGNMIVAMLGAGDLDATIAAYGNMAVDIVVTGTGLTIENVADAVWDAVAADHLNSGSTGEALSAAGSAGDPWITPLPGAYAAGTAGFRVGTDLDAAISSRAAPGAAMTLTGGERDSIANAILDLAAAIDGQTPRSTLKLMASALCGKVSGLSAGLPVFRDMSDSADRVSATCDAAGNRTAVTLTP